MLVFNKALRRGCGFLLCVCLCWSAGSQAQAWAEAHLRGTSNNWAATAMTKNAGGLWETRQFFSGANPRFKVSRNANNWNEAYPAQDFAITGGEGDYTITFNDATKAISVTKVIVPLVISANSICYNNANNHANPFIYFWNPSPAASITNLPAWPGRSMTKRGNFYCYDFSASLSGTMPDSLRVIFSSNGSAQTGDLAFTGNGCYENGNWKSLPQCGFSLDEASSSHAANSSSNTSSAVAVSSAAASVSSVASAATSSAAPPATVIYFHNTLAYTAPHIHYFNTTPAIPATNWPGVAMQDLGGGWFRHNLDNTLNSAGIVFNNNGAPQTANLVFNGALNCYSNGSWKTAAECGVPNGLHAEAGVDRRANVGTRQALSAAASTGDYVTARWTSPAWTGSLTGKQVVTPVLGAPGSYTVTLTLTTADNQTATDSMMIHVAAATRGLPERPQLAAPLGFPISGKVAAGDYRFVKAFPGLDGHFPSPVQIANDGINDLIYVVDKSGTVSAFPNREDVATGDVSLVLDIRTVVRNFHEMGLLSVAFDPDYAANGFIYVYYIHGTNDNEKNADGSFGDAVLERWTVNNPLNPTGVISNSRAELLRVPQPGPDHKGGLMQFHPGEGYLYLGIGDGAYGHSAVTVYPQDPRTNNSAQQTNNLLGTFIRIKPLATPVDGKYYSVPADNPFVGVSGFRPEIWSYGHRNPWRWSFDPQAPHTLWETEVGQQGFEEVNLIRGGENYGWPVCEGTTNRGDLGANPARDCSTDYVPPVEGYGRSQGVSIIGGLVYRGGTLPALNGKFVFGDYVSKRIWAMTDDGEAKHVISEAFPGNIASFGTDISGESLLVTTYQMEYGGTAAIYKMLDDAAEAVQIPAKLSATGLFADLPNVIPAQGVIEYELNTQGWFDGATARHFIALPNDASIGFDPAAKWDLPVGTVLVKHLSVMTANNPAQAFTTAVLFRQETGWQAANYRWNAAGTDADLVTESVTVADGSLDNRQRIVQTGADCGSCHVGSGSKDPLAMHTRQLNTDFDYQGVVNNQLAVFDHIGLFDSDINPADTYGAFAALGDNSTPATERIKSYLDANCAHCHSSSFMDLRYDTALADMHLINEGGTGATRRVMPGSHVTSMVYIYQTTDGNRMPKGTFYTNPLAEVEFAAWIDGLTRDALQTGVQLRSNKTSVPVGGSVAFSLEALFDNGMAGAITEPVLWTSSNPAILDVSGTTDASLTRTALATGSVTITTTAGSYSDSLQLTVTTGSSASSSSSSVAPISAIGITPGTLVLENEQQLVAYGVRSDGTRANLYGQVSWRIASGRSVASVSASGLLTRLTAGEAEVEASYQGMTATLAVGGSAPGLHLRFENTANWAAVRVYLWTVVNGVNQAVAPWPGIAMTLSDEAGPNEAERWTYLVEPQYLHNGSINVIFTNGTGAQTPDLLNIAGSSSYRNGVWTPWNPAGPVDNTLYRLSVIGGTTPDNTRDFPAGRVVTVTASEPPYGTAFAGWAGDGLPYVFSDPADPVVQLVVPERGLALQALFEGDNHSAARDLFAGQCASCHGTKGVGGLAGAVNGLHDSGAWTLEILADYINDFMPMGDSAQCLDTNPGGCAYAIASMIMANAWEVPGGNCTGFECEDTAIDRRNLRLLTKEEYLNSLRDIFGIAFADSLLTSIPSDGGTRNFATSSVLRINEDRARGYQMVAEAIADQAINQKGFSGLVSGCGNHQCVVQQLGRQLFRRPLSTAEADNYLDLYSAADGGRTLVQALLLSPHFMYRSELGELNPDTGLYDLTDYEIATLLSYTLWATTPDAQLLNAADNGTLNVETQVNRMLNDPRAERGLRRFASGWFIYNQYAFAAVERDLAAAFIEETVRFVVESIKENLPFNRLLTANYSYVNPQLAAHYGMAPVSDWSKAFYASGDQRSGAGVLAHGSMLASRAGTDNPSPIKRGVFVRSVLMCQDFPAPAAADFNVIFEPTDSNRDATARHTSDPACASCHQFIDGVGFGFESFGSDGLFRTIETLGNGETRAVDASGSIKSLYSPETVLDPNSQSYDYVTVPQLAALIAESGQGAACYSRQFYRYLLGRNEATEGDEKIIRAYSAGLRNGGGMKDMMIALMLSDSFIRRR